MTFPHPRPCVEIVCARCGHEASSYVMPLWGKGPICAPCACGEDRLLRLSAPIVVGTLAAATVFLWTEILRIFTQAFFP